MRAEMELDGAKAAVARSIEALKLLGVSSVEEAEAKAAELEAALEKLIAQAEAKIEESKG
jgi:ribosomal protein L17